MATTKKTAAKKTDGAVTAQAAPQKATPKSPAPAKKSDKEKSAEELLVDNFATMSKVVAALGTTMDLLVSKTESMAYHIIATEEILSEIVAESGLNLVQVNARIRAKIAAGTDCKGSASQAIDVAAAIASPRPRR